MAIEGLFKIRFIKYTLERWNKHKGSWIEFQIFQTWQPLGGSAWNQKTRGRPCFHNRESSDVCLPGN